MLTIIWDILKNLFSFMWNNKQWAISILLGLLVVILVLSNRHKDDNINHLMHDTKSLSDAKKNLEQEMNGLSLKITFKNRTYDILVLGKDGEIAHQSGYVPEEGSVTFKEFKLIPSKFKTNPDGTHSPTTTTVETKLVAKIIDTATKGWMDTAKRWLHEMFVGPIIESENGVIGITDRGVAFRFGLGLLYDRSQPYGLGLGLDLKLLYLKRLSAGIGVTPSVGYVWGSTHLDKLSLGVINNFEFMMGYGMPYDNLSGGGRFIFGLRSNL